MRRELSVHTRNGHPSELDDSRPEPASSYRVQAALAELRRGRPVLVVDDDHREDTDETMAFVLRHSSGVVCVAMEAARLDALDLPQMVARAEDPMGTAFTVSVDAREGVTTGISAADRTARSARSHRPAHRRGI